MPSEAFQTGGLAPTRPDAEIATRITPDETRAHTAVRC